MQGAPDLSYRLESAWGGSSPLGAEALAVVLFNGGHPLRDAVIELTGKDAGGREVFTVRQTVEKLPRGAESRVEIPSYELPDEPGGMAVSLVSAELAVEE